MAHSFPTRRSSDLSGSTRSHVRQVSVNPCRQTSGGPEPPRCEAVKLEYTGPNASDAPDESVPRRGQEYQRMRGIGSGRWRSGAPERGSARVVELRGAWRRRSEKRDLNMVCILRLIFLGRKFPGRDIAVGSAP